MVDICLVLLEEAQKTGEISPQLNLRETTYFIISSWHGVLMRMKVEKSLAPPTIREASTRAPVPAPPI
jgi:hypothetical protein